MRTKTLLGVLAAGLIGLGGATLRADDPAKPTPPDLTEALKKLKTTPLPPSQFPTPPAPTPPPTKATPAPAAGKKLTDDELLKMVEDLGYEVIIRPKATDEIKRVGIKVKRGTFECPMYVNLSSGDHDQLMTFVNIGKLGDEELANAPALAKLLELNDGVMGQCQFRINAKTKVLWLARISENRGVTSKVLRDHIEETVAAAYDNQDAWDTSKWKKGGTKTEAKAEARPIK
jgi:hypothetical protein